MDKIIEIIKVADIYKVKINGEYLSYENSIGGQEPNRFGSLAEAKRQAIYEIEKNIVVRHGGIKYSDLRISKND